MKKTVLLWVFLACFSSAWAQPAQTSLDLDFSDPTHAERFNFIVDTGGELVKTVENGEMKLVLNKKEWHFFQVWVKPFNLIGNPYLNFRIKTTAPTPIRIWVNQGEGIEKTIFEETIPASNEYQTIARQIEDIAPLTGNIQEINIDIGGYQVPPATFSATVELDHFKVGEAAKPIAEVYGKSYSEDFSAPLFGGWAQGEGYGLSTEDGALSFSVNRSVPVKDNELTKLPSLSFQGKVLDVVAHPYLNMDIKASDPFTLSVIVMDNFKTKKEHKIRVVPAAGYQAISLNLASIPGLDLSKVEKIYFDFNREGFAFQTTALIDNISIGEGAENKPVMDAITDKTYYKSSGSKEILLTHINNATSVALANTPSLLENIAFSPVANGQSKMTFTIKPNQVGEEVIKLNLNGASGYSNNTYTFNLAIENNLPPTLDSIADIQAEFRKSMAIPLSGISDGNSSVEQPLTFTVVSSNAWVATGKVVYKGEGPFATLQLEPRFFGTTQMTVIVKDAGDGNNSKRVSFKVTVFYKLNSPPTIAPVEDVEVYQDAGPSSLTLTGISDGDKAHQKLALTASSSAPAVVKNVSVSYTSGKEAVLHYEPVADTTGKSTITVKLEDKGGNWLNNGNRSTSISFDIEVVKRPVTGYVATLQKSVEGYGANDKYTITEVDSTGFKALVFQANDKFYWDGVMMNLPEELDLSENPFLTMEVYPIDENTLHWIWFWDVTNTRNDLNNREGNHIQRTVAGKWNKLVFDFSGENDWINNGTGKPINNKRIKSILFDMHNADFNWPPPPNYTGTFIVRNIRVGSAADFRPTPMTSVNDVPNQAAFTNQSNQTVKLSGISSGKGNAAGTSISITNSNSSVVINPVVSAISPTGEATFTFSTGDATGKSTLKLTVSAQGATSKEIVFDIDVLNPSPDNAAVVAIDVNKKFQKMYGFGTFSNSSIYTDMYTSLMGGTAMRVGLIENQIEPVNDNDDPNVLNMEGLNYSAFDWSYYRDLKAKGVENFILTSWSPPAWMKTNLSLDYKEAGYELNTDATTNRLDYSMYEEFAESMVAVVKAFQQRAGIDLLGIGLQNEPTFHEPYPSAILDYQKFALLIKVVGKRFEKEGIKTRLYMAEHVSGSQDGAWNFFRDNHAYLKAVKDDPEADKYCDIFAIHGYGSDGIAPGQPKYEAWESYRDSASTGNHPKDIWMTETHKDYNSWQDALDISGAIYGALQYGNVSLWTQWGFEGQMAKQGKPTPMLYAMSNFAKFIRPGDVRVGSTSSNNDILATSFMDEETGDVNIVMVNKAPEPISVILEGQGLAQSWKMYNTAENRNLEELTIGENGVFILPGRSVTTLVSASSLHMEPIADMKVPVGSSAHVVTITGLQNTEGNTEGLKLSLNNSNSSVVSSIVASTVAENGTADLTFTADKNVGSSVITLHLSDKSGNTLSKSFKIQAASSNGRVSAEENKTLVVHPNPSRGVFSIETQEAGKAQIIDVTGRVVYTTQVRAGRQQIQAPTLKSGVYILIMRTPNGNYTNRIMIE